MSRSPDGRAAAWQVWRHMNADAALGLPVAYEHQCGSLGKLPENEADYHGIVCPGCHFELARPESECTPLYGPTGARWPGRAEVPYVLRDATAARASGLRNGLDFVLGILKETRAGVETQDHDPDLGWLLTRLSVVHEAVLGMIERDDRMGG